MTPVFSVFVVQVYKQKVKHLLYEHQNNIAELKAEGTVSLKLAQDGHSTKELDLRKDKRALKVELKEQELSHEDVIKNLKIVSWELFHSWEHCFIIYLIISTGFVLLSWTVAKLTY